MPVSSQNLFDAREFARLMARFDTGNPSEAEAMNAGRALRRMVAGHNLRLVDVFERSDVKQALDDQLQVVREESSELREAFAKITELADLLARERETAAELQRRGSRASVTSRNDAVGLVNGGLVAAVVLIASALMIAAAMH
jgi:C4-dicarboxylate-specific signal transduction histidine kinase